MQSCYSNQGVPVYNVVPKFTLQERSQHLEKEPGVGKHQNGSVLYASKCCSFLQIKNQAFPSRTEPLKFLKYVRNNTLESTEMGIKSKSDILAYQSAFSATKVTKLVRKISRHVSNLAMQLEFEILYCSGIK